MKRVLMTFLLALGLVLPAFADVTVKQTTTIKSAGMSADGGGVMYIKGNKMRTESFVNHMARDTTETVVKDITRISIYDLDAQKLYTFYSNTQEADVWDMVAFSEKISRSVDMKDIKISFKPNGQTKEIAGKSAAGYGYEISVPAAIGGDKDMSMAVTLSGTNWIVKGAPGSQDVINFNKAALDKGWIFTDPKAAEAMPAQSKAVAEMYRQIVEAGGMAYETDMQMKLTSSGPMAAMMEKMGTISMGGVVQSVETTGLSDSLFAVPAGYNLNTKK